jgi:hypothetical protein
MKMRGNSADFNHWLAREEAKLKAREEQQRAGTGRDRLPARLGRLARRLLRLPAMEDET